MDKEHRIFIIFSLFWIILGWLGFISAISGFFYAPVFAIYIILGIGGMIYWRIKKRVMIARFNWPAIFLILIFVIIFSLFTTPTIFSGRDQGSISEAAIRLSQNHQLEFSTPISNDFFKVYGPGRALNFPGFYYLQNGNLTTQFPVPYISWLAIFYSLFGLSGLIIANAVLFFIFALSFYFIFKINTSQKYALFSLFLILASFLFSWIFKFTLSENMAMALVSISILELALFIKKPCNESYYPLLAALGLLFFTRIEGILFLLTALIIIFAIKNTREYLTCEKRWLKIILPLAIFALVFILNFENNFSFYHEIGSALSHQGETNSDKDIFGSNFYTLKIFSLYGMLGYLILGIWGIIYFFKKRGWKILVPFFFVSPSFVYLVDSNISTDHPWMLRRFAFAILPVLIFYSLLFIYNLWQKHKLFGKILFFALIISLFFSGLPAYLKYLDFSENKILFEDSAKISQNFTNSDLVLVDQMASGDGWSMISGPMNFFYGKTAVYFFNPQDFDKIDTHKFNKVYLITPEENINFWRSSSLGSRLNYYQDYSISTTRLDIAHEDTHLPDKINVAVKGKIFEIIP